MITFFGGGAIRLPTRLPALISTFYGRYDVVTPRGPCYDTAFVDFAWVGCSTVIHHPPSSTIPSL